jgi:hypothetical protein
MNIFGISGGVAIGAAVVLLAPIVLPVISGVLKPLAKGVIKGGLLAYEGALVALAETKESLEDITAEAKAEIAAAAKPGITESHKAPAKAKKQAA